jgi:hypothetical protein
MDIGDMGIRKMSLIVSRVVKLKPANIICPEIK